MARKKKYNTSESKNISHNIEKVSSTKNPDFQQEPKLKTSNKFANICHKKCFGSNNWKTFLKTTQNKNSVGIKNPLSNSRKLSYNKLAHKNNFKKERTFPSKSSVGLGIPDVKSTVNKSSASVKMSQKTLKNGKLNEVEPFNQHIVTKESGTDKPLLTKQIAMDCEMVGVEIGVDTNMLARVSLVNALGDCIYDKFVKPTEPVVDYRTHISGVTAKDLENADDFKTVQEEVSNILKGRILVGHALKNDLKVLFLSHPKLAMRDTSKYKRFREYKTPSLKKLAKKYLGVTIQEGEHSSVQDALAAMQLYRMFKKEWESTLKTNNKSKVKKNNISML